MSQTIFSKIIRGEMPSHKVYEDEKVLAFLDIFPLSEGHTLVIPKEPAVTLDELSDESCAAIGRAPRSLGPPAAPSPAPPACESARRPKGATASSLFGRRRRG